jgi:hypothetical protein
VQLTFVRTRTGAVFCASTLGTRPAPSVHRFPAEPSAGAVPVGDPPQHAVRGPARSPTGGQPPRPRPRPPAVDGSAARTGPIRPYPPRMTVRLPGGDIFGRSVFRPLWSGPILRSRSTPNSTGLASIAFGHVVVQRSRRGVAAPREAPSNRGLYRVSGIAPAVHNLKRPRGAIDCALPVREPQTSRSPVAHWKWIRECDGQAERLSCSSHRAGREACVLCVPPVRMDGIGGGCSR